MRSITVESLDKTPVEDQRVELVERKGVGHPDSICDAIMEEISVALCAEYLARFGRMVHHNVGKGLLVAGRTSPKIGGGVVDEPLIASAQLSLGAGVSLASVEGDVERIVSKELNEIYDFTSRLARGEYPIC